DAPWLQVQNRTGLDSGSGHAISSDFRRLCVDLDCVEFDVRDEFGKRGQVESDVAAKFDRATHVRGLLEDSAEKRAHGVEPARGAIAPDIVITELAGPESFLRCGVGHREAAVMCGIAETASTTIATSESLIVGYNGRLRARE